MHKSKPTSQHSHAALIRLSGLGKKKKYGGEHVGDVRGIKGGNWSRHNQDTLFT